MNTGGVLLGHGQVRHVRLRPARHAFDYSAYFLMLPMRHLQALARSHSKNDKSNQAELSINRSGLLSVKTSMMPREKFGFKHFPECWATPSSPSAFGIAIDLTIRWPPYWLRSITPLGSAIAIYCQNRNLAARNTPIRFFTSHLFAMSKVNMNSGSCARFKRALSASSRGLTIATTTAP